jgi:uncharacterized membrane protein
MPVLRTVSAVLSIAHAVQPANVNGLHSFSAAAFTLALISTLIFNVPINLATSRGDPLNPPENWKQVRNKWEIFQALRTCYFLSALCSNLPLLLCDGNRPRRVNA